MEDAQRMAHELSAPLTDLLYTLAEEGGDDEAGDRAGPAWAALLRDGADLRRRALEQLEAGDAVTQNAIEPEDWAALRDAFGVIVRYDNRRNIAAARAFVDEDECLDEWEATRVELEASPPALEAPDTGDSTEGPSSGPMAPRDD
jgi:hypothetical protein